MDRAYYKEYYFYERNHWWSRARLEILEGMVKKYLLHYPVNAGVPINILNIGAATGATSQMLEKFGRVLSVEYDKECCQFLKEKTGITAINASIMDMPVENDSFDVVCAFDVIEHVEDDLKAIEEMNRVAKEGALIMITVPAFMFLWSHHDVVNHHYRRYTLPNLLEVIKDFRLTILFKSYFNFFLFFPITIYRIFFNKILKLKEGTGSDFQVRQGSSFLNNLLYKVFITEKHFLKRIHFPAGVSIIVILQKQGK